MNFRPLLSGVLLAVSAAASCGVGEYQASSGCMLCPKGYFQGNPGQSSCITCGLVPGTFQAEQAFAALPPT